MRPLRAGWAGLASAAVLATLPARAADLAPLEHRWLRGVRPVVEHAQAERLPLDVVVQPQAAPGLPPLATAFVAGRCKLVLSLRGNPQARETMDRIGRSPVAGGDDDAWLDAALELMAAHEVLGHCLRHLDGQWRRAPDGIVDAPPAGLDAALHPAFLDMRATRREEGYADLAGLQWVARRHPRLYPQLHAWLVAERSHAQGEGSHHDTLAWIREPGVERREIAAVWRAVLEAEQR